MGADDNALQQMDIERQEQEALQALMNIASKGLVKEADTLAQAAGLSKLWKAPVKVINRHPWP